MKEVVLSVAFIVLATCLIFLIVYAVRKLSQRKKAKGKPEKEPWRKTAENTAQLDKLRDEIDKLSLLILEREDAIDNDIRNFLCNGCFVTMGKAETYPSARTILNNRLWFMQHDLADLKKVNHMLVSEYNEEKNNARILNAEAAVHRAEKQVDDFKAFMSRLYLLPFHTMINGKSYGYNNAGFLDDVRGMSRIEAVGYIAHCERFFNDGKVKDIYTIDVEKVLKCVWFFAFEKPVSMTDFSKAKAVYTRMCKRECEDLAVADLYVRKAMDGEDALRESIHNLLENAKHAYTLEHVASGLMWMEAYHAEKLILQHMHTTGTDMSAKMLERLQVLSTGVDKTPNGNDDKSTTGHMEEG